MKTRQRKVFEKIVNPLILKHLVSQPDMMVVVSPLVYQSNI